MYISIIAARTFLITAIWWILQKYVTIQLVNNILYVLSAIQGLIVQKGTNFCLITFMDEDITQTYLNWNCQAQKIAEKWTKEPLAAALESVQSGKLSQNRVRDSSCYSSWSCSGKVGAGRPTILIYEGEEIVYSCQVKVQRTLKAHSCSSLLTRFFGTIEFFFVKLEELLA